MGSLKESFSKRERQLVAEKTKALDSFQQIETQFRLCDDAFRQQLAERTKQNDAVYTKLQQVQEEVCPSSWFAFVPLPWLRGGGGFGRALCVARLASSGSLTSSDPYDIVRRLKSSASVSTPAMWSGHASTLRLMSSSSTAHRASTRFGR